MDPSNVRNNTQDESLPFSQYLKTKSPPLSPHDLLRFFAVTSDEMRKPWPPIHPLSESSKRDSKLEKQDSNEHTGHRYIEDILDLFHVEREPSSPVSEKKAVTQNDQTSIYERLFSRFELWIEHPGDRRRLECRVKLFILVRTYILEWIDAEGPRCFEANRLKGLRLERNSRHMVHQGFGLLYEFQRTLDDRGAYQCKFDWLQVLTNKSPEVLEHTDLY